ncbi:hypothetical protein ACHAXH_007885 [Discostella pseudostelligera]
MVRGNLTNRSSRYASASALNNDNGVPQHDIISSCRDAQARDAQADDMTVKSNSGLPPPRYVLPCFRCRSKKSAAMVLIASAAILVSICSAIIASRSLSTSASASPSGHFYLPSSKEWGADRERRIRGRQTRRKADFPTDIDLGVKDVNYTEYESHLLNFLFSLRAAGIKSSMLPLNNDEPLGQDMGIYSNLGCSMFNGLNGYHHRHNSTAFDKDEMQQLWSSHFSTVLQASRHADDVTYLHEKWTATILKSLSPYSILDHLSDNEHDKIMRPSDIERISGILVRRLLGLLQNGGRATMHNMPPPLRIAVFGGPTVEGKGCHRANVAMPHGSSMTNPAFCAFPYRLEQFLNAMLLPPTVLMQLRRTLRGLDSTGSTASKEDVRLVEVINFGGEGTGSEYSTTIIRNRMYPPLLNNTSTGYGGGPPDLMIDAYGIDGYENGEEETSLIYDEVGHSLPKGCLAVNQKPPPVIIRAVLKEDASPMTIILGDAVDDVEEGEQSLPTNHKSETTKLLVGGAFGMAGHVATSWALAFNLATHAIHHCKSIIDSPPVQQIIPQRRRNNTAFLACDNGVDPPCAFSFLAGPKGTAHRPSAIASILMPYIVENTGWLPESDMTTGFSRKTGLVGKGVGSTMTLLFRGISRPIRRLDVITLRSTSPAWKDGAAKFVLVTGGDVSHGSVAAEESSKVAKEFSFEISADLIAEKWNGEDRHISYHYGVDLMKEENVAHLGTDVLLRIELTKGSRFKILGIMLCE